MTWNVLRSVLRSGLTLALPLCCSIPKLHAQAEVETVLQHQLHRVDFALSGIGVFNGSTSGTVTYNASPEVITVSPSNTLGGLATLRYTKSALLGAEFNYSYARFNQNYSSNAAVTDVQTNVNEFSVGYVAHGPELFGFGVKPFGAVGAGSTAFTPTTFGGQLLREQARATYYYAAGVEAPLLLEGRFGVRAQVRQTFYLAPDFGQNYLTIKQHTSTFEPGFGFYLHF